MESRMCKTCVYAHPIKGSEWVECRRYPPVGASSTRSGFPTSPEDAWCGEFKRLIAKVAITERA